MLLSIRFKNLRSFRDDAELSLIAHRADKSLQSCLLSPDMRRAVPFNVVPVIAIYGANSAGKTNVLKAIHYLRDAVVDSHNSFKPNSGTHAVRFGEKGGRKGSATIEVNLIVEGVRYRLGFSADDRMFSQEWLYSYPSGRERELYFRKTERKRSSFASEIRFGDRFSKDETLKMSLQKRIRENSLVVSAAAQENHPICAAIYGWFQRDLETERLGPAHDQFHTQITSELIVEKPDLKEQVVNFLRSAEPNLIDIEVTKTAESDSRLAMIESLGPKAQAFRELYKYDVSFIVDSGDHRMKLGFAAQSAGFQKLYAIAMRIIWALKGGDTLIIDEIESSIHPHLARHIVDLFQNPDANTGKGQIIFTTHDTGLLDQSLLRRDQIWFVEKDKCCSKLYSLLDFSPRKDEKLEKGYLRGRYGAIPALGISGILDSVAGSHGDLADA